MKRAASLCLCVVAVLPLGSAGCGRSQPPKTAVVRNGPGTEAAELQRALHLAVRAVEQYERQAPEQALVSLRMAEEIARPAAQSSGQAPLVLLTGQLPGHYRKYDLPKLKAQLEASVQVGGGPAGAVAQSGAGRAVEGGITPPPVIAPEDRLPGEGHALLREETFVPGATGGAVYTAALPPGLQGVAPPRSVQVHAVDQHTFVRNELDRLMAEFGEARFDAPADFMNEIHRTIAWFQTERRDFFQNALNRSALYAPMVQKLFAKKGVPPDMIYMAFVESGFRPDAVSHSGAVGLWQFMAGTARDYGMSVGRSRDDRRDPVRATIAAREYFLDLLSIFGTRSWLLAMAAYNAGENKIASCLKKIDDPFAQRTFWHIRACLRAETQDYVPRILAAAIIAADPQRFGFQPPRRAAQRSFETVALPGHTSIAALVRAAGISHDELLDLNPDLNRGQTATPAATHEKSYRLNVPAGTGQSIVAQWPELARIGQSLSPGPSTAVASSHAGSKAARGSGSGGGATRSAQKPPSYFVYKVASGNTMAEIAQTFGAGSYKNIMKWNKLKRSTVVRSQNLKIYRPYRRIQYTVRRGDTLGKIARKYGVSVESVKFFNGLKRSTVLVGQTLSIYVRAK